MLLAELSFDVNNDEYFYMVDNELIKLSTQKENEIVFPAQPYTLVYPISPSLDKFREVSYSPANPVTINDFLDQVFNFYEETATPEIISYVRAAGYPEFFIEELFKNGIICGTIGNALGETVHFRGLEEIKTGVYKVVLE